MGDHRGRRLAAAFNADLYVPALKLKLRDIFFYQEIDKLFQLFLIHELYSALLALITSNCGESGLSPMKLKRDQVLCGRRQDFMSVFGDKNHIFDADTTIALAHGARAA